MFNFYSKLKFKFSFIFFIKYFIQKVKIFFSERYILNQYIFRELFVTYLAIFLFLNMILFSTRIFSAVYWLMELNLPVSTVFTTLFLYFVIISEYTLPLAMILSTILAISRFSDDGEIIGMESSGVSVYKIFRPIFFFGMIVSCFIFVFYEFFLPKFKKEYALSELRIHQINPSGELSKKLFYETIKGDIISVESVKKNKLKNIWIKFVTQNQLIFSSYGYLLKRNNERNVFPLILFNSITYPLNTLKSKDKYSFMQYFNARQIIYIPDQPLHMYIPKSYFYFSITEFSNALEAARSHISTQNLRRINDFHFFELQYKKTKKEIIIEKKAKNKSVKELKLKIKAEHFLKYIREQKRRLDEKYMYKNISSYDDKSYYFYRQVNLIFSTFIFCILGSSLGVFNKRSGKGKSVSFGIGMLLIALFLAMVFGGNILLQKDVLSSFLSASYFNLVYFILAIYFFFARVVDKNSEIKYKLRRWKAKSLTIFQFFLRER